MKMKPLETPRLTLRAFTDRDSEALLSLLGDKVVNTFLPMFPLRDREEAEAYLQHIDDSIRKGGLYYAVCLKAEDVPIGCVHVSADDSHDLGYAFRYDYWHRGFCTESCSAVVDLLRRTGTPYVTATHDVNNPRSGHVMQALGMTYKYSYREQWQPKDISVTFRMYQLDLDGQVHETYRKYWDRYKEHFVEPLLTSSLPSKTSLLP